MIALIDRDHRSKVCHECNPAGSRHRAVFRHFGVVPVINGCGIYTDLGGSRLSPRVWAAMEEANRSFVRMTDLLDRTGERIAGLLGAEAAPRGPPVLRPPSCSAPPPAWPAPTAPGSQQLPDTTGMRSEVLIQAAIATI